MDCLAMKIESDIIVACQLKCIDRDITARQVHDALIVPEGLGTDLPDTLE